MEYSGFYDFGVGIWQCFFASVSKIIDSSFDFFYGLPNDGFDEYEGIIKQRWKQGSSYCYNN